MKITLELTPHEAKVLREHWTANLSCGVGGTFGDGYKVRRAEQQIGFRILGKLETEIEKQGAK